MAHLDPLLQHYLNFVPRYELKSIAREDEEELSNELPNVVMRIRQCEEQADWESVTRLCKSLTPYLVTRGYRDEWVEVCKSRLLVARKTGSLCEEAAALADIGLAYRDSGQPDKAIDWLEESLEVAKKGDDREDRQAEGRALTQLGEIYASSTDGLVHAIKLICRGITVAEEIGDELGQQAGLEQLARAYRERRDTERAGDSFIDAIRIARKIADSRTEARILGELGVFARKAGDIEQSRSLHEQQLDIARQHGFKEEEANALRSLGNVEVCVGKHGLAEVLYLRSADAARHAGHRGHEASALANLGLAYAGMGRTSDAIENLKSALVAFLDINDKSEIAITSYHLASAFERAGELPKAAEYAGRARDMLRLTGNWSALVQTQAFIERIEVINTSATSEELQEYTLQRRQVAAAAEFQAAERGESVADAAREFVEHYVTQEVGYVGGRIDFPVKVDLLVKTYWPELAAQIILRFPSEFRESAVTLLKHLDAVWSKGSSERAAETAVCYLSLLEERAARAVVVHMAEDTRKRVSATATRMRNAAPERRCSAVAVVSEPVMLCIEAGEFLYGTSNEQARLLSRELKTWERFWFEGEMPQTRPQLDAYWIDKYPVTNSRYKEFVDATGYPVPWREGPLAKPYNWDRTRRTYPESKGEHPVVCVDWRDASAYAKWAGKRLPTEFEWEKAARGIEGNLWPWGNSWNANLCNHGKSLWRGTTPVTSYEEGKSPYGVVDMAGNVWEWCDVAPRPRRERHLEERSLSGSSSKVIRGGCFHDEYPEQYRCAVRDVVRSDFWEVFLGFRCVESR